MEEIEEIADQVLELLNNSGIDEVRMGAVLKVVEVKREKKGIPKEVVRDIYQWINSQKPVFEIQDNGNHYKIYANGWIEGFGDNASICNHLPRVSHLLPKILPDGVLLPVD